MQLSDATHDYSCRCCGGTQGVCMEALWLARRLAATIAGRADELPQGFEVTSDTRFTGCGQDCAVQLRIASATVEVTAGNQGARVEAAALAAAGPRRAATPG